MSIEDWRRGGHVDLNIYGPATDAWPRGRPICQTHSSDDAARIVAAVNAHTRATRLLDRLRLVGSGSSPVPPTTTAGGPSADYQAGVAATLRFVIAELAAALDQTEPRPLTRIHPDRNHARNLP